jgi:hypothetical protein
LPLLTKESSSRKSPFPDAIIYYPTWFYLRILTDLSTRCWPFREHFKIQHDLGMNSIVNHGDDFLLPTVTVTDQLKQRMANL